VLDDKNSQHKKVPNTEIVHQLWLHSLIKQESGSGKKLKHSNIRLWS